MIANIKSIKYYRMFARKSIEHFKKYIIATVYKYLNDDKPVFILIIVLYSIINISLSKS